MIGKFVCWSRMQSEAGQPLEHIIARKENERLSNGGVFFWGVGNAPSTLIAPLARMEVAVPMVFSIMKGKPKAHDIAPASVVAWRRYVDQNGNERPLPPSILVTSRGDSSTGVRKSKHFALICQSQEPLAVVSGKPFNHRSYRNAGVNGGAVGASQVTALLTPSIDDNAVAEYEANMEASLADAYWVRLTDPVQLSESQLRLYARSGSLSVSDWVDYVSDIRQKTVRVSDTGRQLGLF